MNWFLNLFNRWKSKSKDIDTLKIPEEVDVVSELELLDSIGSDEFINELDSTEKVPRLDMKVQIEVTEIINKFKGLPNTAEVRSELKSLLNEEIQFIQSQLNILTISWDALGHLVPDRDRDRWINLCTRSNLSLDSKLLICREVGNSEFKIIFNPIIVVLVNRHLTYE